MFSRLILSMTFCGMATSQLVASTYTSTHKTTVMGLLEGSDPWSLTRGYYTTRVDGQPIFGLIQLHSVEIKAGLFTWQGTFEDRSYGSDHPTTCSGRIVIKRVPDAELTSPFAMRVTFLPEASSCQYSHQKISLTLREALPIADGYGEYLPSNSNTMLSETNGDVTWMAWRVTSPDGTVNCRTKDTGGVVHVYGNEDVIFADTRGGNALDSEDSKSWLLTRKGCFVRANSFYIAPLSVPEQYLP